MFKKYLKTATVEIVKNGLVLWFDGHDFTNIPNTTSLRDRSGIGNNGIPNGMTYTTTSGSNEFDGIKFDGINDVINCGNNASFNSNFITLEAKINIPSAPTTSGRLICKETGTDTTPYSFFIQADRKVALFRAAVGIVTSINLVPIGIDTIVSATTDGTNAKIYINGIQDNTAIFAGTMAVNTTNVLIGNNSTLNRQFAGTLKSAKIYNRGLTASEILQNYSASK